MGYLSGCKIGFMQLNCNSLPRAANRAIYGLLIFVSIICNRRIVAKVPFFAIKTIQELHFQFAAESFHNCIDWLTRALTNDFVLSVLLFEIIDTSNIAIYF